MNAVAEAKTGEIVTWDDRAAPPVMPLTPMDMLNRAVSQGANIDVLEKLMALNERWEASQARRAFDDAIASAKAEIPPIRKNRHVGFAAKNGGARTDYDYEDLAEIARTIDPILGKHGLTYRWRTTSEVNQPIVVTCILSHRAGHREENTLMAGRDESGNKNSIQAVGSTATFLQRYTLKASLGLAAANDDDGRAAGASVASDTITQDQADNLRLLIEDVGANLPIFLKYYKIERVEDLPGALLAKAIANLESKRKPK